MSKQKALIIMPFSELDGKGQEYWKSYAAILSSRVEKALGGKCEPFFVGAEFILDQLMEAIIGSDLVLCDLTWNKPNVLFELGMAFILKKPIILLLSKETQPPSDLSGLAYIRYEFTPVDGDKSADLEFPSMKSGDLLTATLLKVKSARSVIPAAIRHRDIRDTLKVHAGILSHMIRLHDNNSILAPALSSLFESLIVENARKLNDLVAGQIQSTQIEFRRAEILFQLLGDLLANLDEKDKYDSITWRKHWLGENRTASEQFLSAIRDRGDRLPAMRRIFLLGAKRDKNGWVVVEEDRSVLASYSNEIRGAPAQFTNFFVALREQDIEFVANRCHMGRIQKDADSLFVHSIYDSKGTLISFKVTTIPDERWSFEKFLSVSRPLNKIMTQGNSAWRFPKECIKLFDGEGKQFSYRGALGRLMKDLGWQPLA